MASRLLPLFCLSLVTTASATLNLTRGAGIHALPGDGLTDKQLGLLNWFHHILRGDRSHDTGAAAAADTKSYGWDAPWKSESQVDTGLSGLRYQVAFSAYAAAELTAAHTPAFPALTSTILRDAFARLVAPITWEYWDKPGTCGFPWSGFCKLTNLSMCEMNPLAKHSGWCPDPVKYQNVMYSGHLAHVGALYELFSGDSSLTEVGWAFDGPPNARRGVGPIPYTLPKLLEAIHAQSRWSGTGAFACEPTVVYLVCNQHTYTAAKLYDALQHTGGKYSSERVKWLNYLNSTAVRRHPKDLLGEGYFEILYQEQLREAVGVPWVEVLDIGGCAGNDGWAGMALGFWAGDDEAHGGAAMLRGVRAVLAANRKWVEDPHTGGAYLEENSFYEGRGYTTELSTSWAGAALGGWGGKYASRVEGAILHMEHTYGEAIDTDADGVEDAFHYRIDKKVAGSLSHGQEMWATANLAISMARNDAVVSSVYDGSLMMRARAQPHLETVTPGAPKALVRRAVFETKSDGDGDGTLRLALTTAAAAAVEGVELMIAVPAGWKRAGEEAGGGASAPTSFVMHVDIPADRDVEVKLPFEKCEVL